MARKKPAAAPPDKVGVYDKLIRTHPKIERQGASIPYTSCNGHMFSYLSASGVVQKEYVTVPNALLEKTKELQPYLVLSYDYVKSLKPKPATKKK